MAVPGAARTRCQAGRQADWQGGCKRVLQACGLRTDGEAVVVQHVLACAYARGLEAGAQPCQVLLQGLRGGGRACTPACFDPWPRWWAGLLQVRAWQAGHDGLGARKGLAVLLGPGQALHGPAGVVDVRDPAAQQVSRGPGPRLRGLP